MPSARFIVRGKVQGVWFRAGTRDVARRLGLAGHAANLADGSVEVCVAGDAEAIACLQDWLHQGSPLARVDAVQRLPWESATGTPAAVFTIR